MSPEKSDESSVFRDMMGHDTATERVIRFVDSEVEHSKAVHLIVHILTRAPPAENAPNPRSGRTLNTLNNLVAAYHFAENTKYSYFL